MSYEEMKNFFYNIEKYTEEEIISKMPFIKKYFQEFGLYYTKEYIKNLIKGIDKNRIIYEILKDEEKYIQLKDKLDLPDNLKFGIEIEVTDLPLEAIKEIFDTNSAKEIMDILEIPSEISEKIINNSDFEKKNEFSKWIFSRETSINDSEASSPIMKNNLVDLNQIIAICTFLKSLNARTDGGTALHINISEDYLEYSEKALENLLKIWSECEELFFKMASPENEKIRILAGDMAQPLKSNIQAFLKENENIVLKTEENIEKFMYLIQARNRMDEITQWLNLGPEYMLNYDFHCAETEEEIFKVYQRYNEVIKNRENIDPKVRWVSINFNHMNWDKTNPGRIEVRIFNSSLEPKVIFEDLLLVSKIFEVSLKNAKNPNHKKLEFEQLFIHEVTEKEKMENLLDLLFDEEPQKVIFKKRWESVKENEEYQKYISGEDTFKRSSKVRKH